MLVVSKLNRIKRTLRASPSVATENPFVAEKSDTRQLTIEAIKRLLGKYSTTDVIAALIAEAERLSNFTQQGGGMLAYELSLPYREALYNCNAALVHLQEKVAR